MDSNLIGDLTIKKGDKLDNPRGGLKHPFQFKLAEGYAVLLAKVKRFANVAARQLGATLPDDTRLYFRRSKSAVQSQFSELTLNNFEDSMKYQWAKILQGDLQKWQDEGKTAAELLHFEFFLYIPRPRRAATTIRRATANQIQEAAEALRQFKFDNNVQLGEIQRNHLQIHYARQPEGTEVTIPQDNTTRQAGELDREMAELQRENEEQERLANNNLKTIRIEINNQLINVRVDIASLQTALSLPQHDLFHAGIYQNYRHPTLDEADNIDDVDHQEEEQENEIEN